MKSKMINQSMTIQEVRQAACELAGTSDRPKFLSQFPEKYRKLIDNLAYEIEEYRGLR